MQFIIEISYLRQEVSTSRPGFIDHQHRIRLMVALIFERDRATEDGMVTHCWRSLQAKSRGEMWIPLPSCLREGGDYPQSLAESQQEASHDMTAVGV